MPSVDLLLGEFCRGLAVACGLSGVLMKRSCRVSTEVGCCSVLRYSVIVDGVLKAQTGVGTVDRASGPNTRSRLPIGDSIGSLLDGTGSRGVEILKCYNWQRSFFAQIFPTGVVGVSSLENPFATYLGRIGRVTQ